MKCSRENVTLRGIFHVLSRFPLHFMLYRGNFKFGLLFFVQCTPLIRILIYLKLYSTWKEAKKNYFPFHQVKNSLEPKNVFLKFKTFFLANVQCSMKWNECICKWLSKKYSFLGPCDFLKMKTCRACACSIFTDLRIEFLKIPDRQCV